MQYGKKLQKKNRNNYSNWSGKKCILQIICPWLIHHTENVVHTTITDLLFPFAL